MGFDLAGLAPKINEVVHIPLIDWGKADQEEKDAYFEANNKHCRLNPGVYFRNNVWWWRPLWDYTCGVCSHIMSAEQQAQGGWNNGFEYDADIAERMAKMLQEQILDGSCHEYMWSYGKHMEDLPDEQCDLCNGTGTRNDVHTEFKDRECNKCGGKGKHRPFSTNYPFSVENVQEFVNFLRESGGFYIG